MIETLCRIEWFNWYMIGKVLKTWAFAYQINEVNVIYVKELRFKNISYRSTMYFACGGNKFSFFYFYTLKIDHTVELKIKLAEKGRY